MAGHPYLEDQDELRRRRLAELDAAIARGIADAEAGQVVPADEVFTELRGRYQAMADRRNK
jgi:antitoxin ParD1/3/4